ncbi:MAG: U32 family peptidase C-terminal domain-containing protein, partial [Clostridia bacterium]|nr:U32 family peptidase C-terminal domain-containing protein [Clostridia bacterium]
VREALPDLEIEAFVHGAMCVSHSGRCLLSAFMAARSANHGACAHPCRWKYVLMEEKRPGEYMPIEEDAHGTYVMNSRDLCMIGRIPDLISAGIDSFKIEGRMKNALYVAVTARAYRRAIDDAVSDPLLYQSRIEAYLSEIKKCTYRPFTTGFYDGAPQDSILYDSCDYQSGAVYLGEIEAFEDGQAVFTQRNKFSVGDEIEVMKPDGRNLRLRVASIRREDGSSAQSAPHPKERLQVALEGTDCEEAEIGDILRSIK